MKFETAGLPDISIQLKIHGNGDQDGQNGQDHGQRHFPECGENGGVNGAVKQSLQKSFEPGVHHKGMMIIF